MASIQALVKDRQKQFPWLLSPSPPHSRCTCKQSQFLSQVYFKSPLQIQTHNTQANTASVVLVIVQSSSSSLTAVCSVRHEAMHQDKPIDRFTTQLSPSPLLRYYRDVCPRYCHYHSKIYSVVPVTADYRGITVVPLPCSSLITALYQYT